MKNQMSQTTGRSIVMGIDPGVKGAVGIIDLNPPGPGFSSAVFDLPVKSSKAGESGALEIDAAALSSLLDIYKDQTRICVIEKVSAMVYTDKFGQRRGQGAAASFAFGKGYGVITGTLTALGIPYVEVVPAVWKIGMGLGSDKATSLQRAREMFPDSLEKLKLKSHDGRAEALLLAKFGVRSFGIGGK